MLQQTTTPHKLLVRDNNGNWYSIPEMLVNDFRSIKESLIELEIGSDEWFEASESLSSMFEEYIV